jgi:hypothetical protein
MKPTVVLNLHCSFLTGLQMSIIFDRLKTHAKELQTILESRAFLIPENTELSHLSQTYSSAWFRRGNIDVIDATETKKLWMMHLCIFPHVYDGAPIYGFDIIAGANKVTGAFLDLSPVDPNHKLCDWFKGQAERHSWSKPRELPPWAKSIFSDNIIAAGNINTEFELLELLDLNKKCLTYYLDNIENYRPAVTFDDQIKQYNYTDKQNHYCIQQKQNPHTPRVLKSLGFEEDKIAQFINHCLFPQL